MGKLTTIKRTSEKISPRLALLRIAEALDGKDWNPDTIMEIAGIVEEAGYIIRNSEEIGL